MPRYRYTAIESASGREQRGSIEAPGPEAASALLKSRGLAPTGLVAADGPAPKAVSRATAPSRPARRFNPVLFGRTASARQRAVFIRQLAMLLKAGLPLVRALEVLGRQERHPGLHAAVGRLAGHIRAGGTLSEGMQQHPELFDALCISMVRAGEAGGVLETVLDRVARFQERNVRLRGRIRAAMTYPLIILLVACGIVAALLVLVVPRFEQIFAGTLKGQSLPLLTQLVLTTGNFARDHFLVILVVAVAGGIGAARLARTPAGTRVLDRLALRLPVLGDLVLRAAVARFTRTFGTLLASGVPILHALNITRDTSGNVGVAAAIGRVHDAVKGGDTVARPLRAGGVFPDMVASMIEVGEETGALPEVLMRIADVYDEEVDNAVLALTALVEPLMIVVMAVMVGTIVIALFLPIVRIVQGLG